MKYIWQHDKWPQLTWRTGELETILSEASYRHGAFIGRLQSLGFELRTQAGFEALSEEIVSSSAIEGELLNIAEVRSSVARRMDIVLARPESKSSHFMEARVDLMMDAIRQWREPMTIERLCSWQAAIFPTGYSGLARVKTGEFRDDVDGPMRVVSRRGMLERVHFQAPPAKRLAKEMKILVAWLNAANAMPPLIKMAIGHLRFLTIHPFDDGNGRIARALTEWMLSRCEQSDLRFYSLSAQIQREKEEYYSEIEHAQRNSLDVTRWISWFVGCHRRAIEAAEVKLSGILAKAEFWKRHANDDLNAHQREMLNRMLDGFDGNVTSSKWAKICKISQDTASREIAPLVALEILQKVGQGRSTHFCLAECSHA